MIFNCTFETKSCCGGLSLHKNISITLSISEFSKRSQSTSFPNTGTFGSVQSAFPTCGDIKSESLLLWLKYFGHFHPIRISDRCMKNSQCSVWPIRSMYHKAQSGSIVTSIPSEPLIDTSWCGYCSVWPVRLMHHQAQSGNDPIRTSDWYEAWLLHCWPIRLLNRQVHHLVHHHHHSYPPPRYQSMT